MQPNIPHQQLSRVPNDPEFAEHVQRDAVVRQDDERLGRALGDQPVEVALDGDGPGDEGQEHEGRQVGLRHLPVDAVEEPLDPAERVLARRLLAVVERLRAADAALEIRGVRAGLGVLDHLGVLEDHVAHLRLQQQRPCFSCDGADLVVQVHVAEELVQEAVGVGGLLALREGVHGHEPGEDHDGHAVFLGDFGHFAVEDP